MNPEYELHPFLIGVDMSVRNRFVELTAAFDAVFEFDDNFQLPDETIDIEWLIGFVDARIGEDGRHRIWSYYRVAYRFLENVAGVLPKNREDVGWLNDDVQRLLSFQQGDFSYRALCFYHHALRNIYQFLQISVKGEEADIERELVARASERLRTTIMTLVHGAIDMALNLPAAIPQAAVAIWQNLYRSYITSGQYTNQYMPFGLSSGISFADLAYGEVDGVDTGCIIKTLKPIGITIAGVQKQGVIDLGHDLRVVLCKAPRHDAIAVCFRGTVNTGNWLTNIIQFCLCDDIVYRMALGVVLTMAEQYPDRNINVYGHSLGGGLTQFSVAAADNDRITGYGYNSAGLSKMTLSRLPTPTTSIQINHFHLRNDVVFNIGHHIGLICQSACWFNTGANLSKIIEVHGIDKLRIVLKCNRYWRF